MPAKPAAKTAEKKVAAKPAEKKAATKPAEKKAASKPTSKPAEKKATKAKLNQCVAFIYGGSLIKASHVYLFAVENGDAVEYVREHLTPYFGHAVTGRYVKCEDAEATLASVYETAEEKEYIVDADCKNILKCNVGEAADLLKTVADVNVAHTIKLGAEEEKPAKAKASKAKKPATKGKKAAKDDEEELDAAEDEEEDVEDAEDADEEEGEDAEEAEEGDEAEAEEEEEEVKPAKKSAPQKGGNKAGNGGAKGKESEKAKAPKKGK
ncbi:hypothetical protein YASMINEVIRUS_1044 [Yasminevirus sp. GU-2018]|uniref:Uncharacterized protein n=1 Tax=Yasminevirus sp. GU-2018 TaxID=2420051 RepID=A0A5K0UAF7_9VIRU|nr:hypothetical protein YASMINEVIRUS_1044 [Yasminevirus sp. GU-2018]